jgi:hypothetical protein
MKALLTSVLTPPSSKQVCYFLSLQRLQNAERFIDVDIEFPINAMSRNLAFLNCICDLIILKAIFGSERASRHEALKEFGEFLNLIQVFSPVGSCYFVSGKYNRSLRSSTQAQGLGFIVVYGRKGKQTKVTSMN